MPKQPPSAALRAQLRERITNRIAELNLKDFQAAEELGLSPGQMSRLRTGDDVFTLVRRCRRDLRKTHPQIRWAIANTESGNLLSLFLLLTVATSSLQGAWLNPLPYLEKFKVFDVQFGI